jgi:L-aminopeptidase/D-esterase-like protein
MLTDIDHIRVGHGTDHANGTGCTVVLFDTPTVAGVDVRGANPTTKDTDLIRPMSIMPEAHAVVLTGGSCFGLESAMGVARYLEGIGRGYDVGPARIPIVPAAGIYDLSYGSAKVRPDIAMGMRACEDATSGPYERGSVGAGTGATIGKLYGPANSSKGGVGTASVRVRGEIIVAALVVVNTFGDVVDRASGEILAGTMDADGRFVDTYARQKAGEESQSVFGSLDNTLIGIVCCNGRLNKAEANRVASMAHNGIARAVSPAHTSVDGDTLFATGRLASDLRCPVDLVGGAAAEAVELAILDAVRSVAAAEPLAPVRV